MLGLGLGPTGLGLGLKPSGLGLGLGPTGLGLGLSGLDYITASVTQSNTASSRRFQRMSHRQQVPSPLPVSICIYTYIWVDARRMLYWLCV